MYNNNFNNNSYMLDALVEETEAQRKQIEALNKDLKTYKIYAIASTILLIINFINN